MGSKGKKPRKPSHSQHLPKVGSQTEMQRAQHDERHAVMDTMGLGHAGKGGQSVAWIVGAVMLVGAVVGLIILTVALS